ncbi:MAG: VWA domain-containing protein [Synergistaceae bacterium]|nr:VWA domain-containing protein [Synergistaceae bacterium]
MKKILGTAAIIALIALAFTFTGAMRVENTNEAEVADRVETENVVQHGQVPVESEVRALETHRTAAPRAYARINEMTPPPPPLMARPAPQQETARYAAYEDNLAQRAGDSVSTFGLDVSTASYANVRRFLNSGRFPNPDAVRVEEMINYFPTLPGEQRDRAKPLANSPFYVGYETAPCPWNAENTLLWLTVEARGIDYREAPPANLVFLVDISGSMSPPERLPLAQASLKLLTERLRPEDSVSIVTYASSVGVVLPPTSGDDKPAIRRAIDGLRAGGSTAGGAALQMAYEQAEKGFKPGGVNRILLCTDGDFNVGVSDTSSLTRMVAQYRQKGITLSVLGFGTENLNDAMMVSIASAGNGNYSYIDGLMEAQKVLGEEMAATLVTVANDVKAQVEFNPAVAGEYRQIGYEKRQLRREDFNDDRVDAGDIGAGKRVTVLYELTPKGKRSSDPLRYRSEEPERPLPVLHGDEMGYVKLRWKEPGENASSLAELPIMNAPAASFSDAGSGLRFSAAVAAFGQKLRGNPELSATSWKDIAAWADNARGSDEGGYRAELVRLVGLAESLAR